MKKLFRFWPIFFICSVWVVLFWPVFSKGLLPIPADIITGVYYPWLDYKWGFITGVPVKNPLLSDIPSLLYPWRSFAIDEFKSGRWPLWNPYYFAGMPLLANFQSAVFSYVNIFFLFFSKPLAWSFGVMLSPILTMLAVYFFLHQKKLDRLACLLGAIVFSLSGFQTAWLEYNVHGHTVLFLPLLLLAIDRIFANKKNWYFLLSIFVAFQIFAGYIPVVIYSYLIILFYLLYFYFLPQLKNKKIFWENYLLIFWFFILGLGLAAIQLMPGYELTVNSIRKIDPLVAASGASYLPLRHLLTLVAPDFFGNPAFGNYFGQAFYDNFYFFVGTGTLILIFYSFFLLKKNKEVKFWCLLVFFSFLLVFKNPVGVFLEKILFLSGGVSARALFITDFSLAILAAFGLDTFLKTEKKKKIIIPIILIALFFLVALLFALKLSSSHRIIAVRNLAIPFFVWIFCSLILLVEIRYPKMKLTKVALVCLISSQLLYSARKYLPFSKKELLFPVTPIIDYLQQEQKKSEPFRVELGEVVPQNFLMPYGLQTVSGYDALLPILSGEFLSLIETGEVSDKISRVWLMSNFESPYFPLLNIKYILAKKIDAKGIYSPLGKTPEYFNQTRFKKVFEDKTVVIFEDKNFFPRARYLDFSFDNQPKEGIKNLLNGKNTSARQKISWQEYLPDRKVFTTDFEKQGEVVIADFFYPGWEAKINGQKSEITMMGGYFQSVFVPEGKSLVELKYKPKSFFYGKLISAACFLIFILLFVLDALKRQFLQNGQA